MLLFRFRKKKDIKIIGIIANSNRKLYEFNLIINNTLKRVKVGELFRHVHLYFFYLFNIIIISFFIYTSPPAQLLRTNIEIIQTNGCTLLILILR